MTFLILCLEFMKTGLFAVGGGLATIPFLYEISNQYGWFSHHDILNFIAVSESTPGPVGVNMATYAGYVTGGIGGGILSTLSLILPSFVIIMIVARALEKFRDNRFVTTGFHILRPASTALIAAAGFNVVLIVFFSVEKITFSDFGNIPQIFTQIHWIAIGLGICFFIALRIFKKVHPIVLILIAAGLGILLEL